MLSFCSFLQASVTSSLLGPNEVLGSLFSSTLHYPVVLQNLKSQFPEYKINTKIPKEKNYIGLHKHAWCRMTYYGRTKLLIIGFSGYEE
jgi:hypothetical protein